MGRTLPWLVQGASSSSKPSTTKRAVRGSRPTKRQKLDDDGALSGRNSPASDFRTSTSSRPNARNVSATRKADGGIPSSSPPPVEEPVSEEFMREGLQQDDIFMMVEDEFYDVARVFTAHIHQQEYDRLRRQARERNALTTTNIARPVDGKTVLPKERQKAKERNAAAAKRTAKMGGRRKKASDSEDEDERQPKTEQGWAGTTLGGLLSTPTKAQKSLIGLRGPAVDTRAAAGFKEAQVTPSKKRVVQRPVSDHEDSETASEDDLDAPPAAVSRRNMSKPEATTKRSGLQELRGHSSFRAANSSEGNGHGRPANTLADSSKSAPTRAESSTLRPSTSYKKGSNDRDPDDGVDAFLKPRPLINRRNRIKVKEEDAQEKKKLKLEEIPLFL